MMASSDDRIEPLDDATDPEHSEIQQMAQVLVQAAEQVVADLEGSVSTEQRDELDRLVEYLRLLQAVGPDRTEFRAGVEEVARLVDRLSGRQDGDRADPSTP
jgi:hypothetical protein